MFSHTVSRRTGRLRGFSQKMTGYLPDDTALLLLPLLLLLLLIGFACVSTFARNQRETITAATFRSRHAAAHGYDVALLSHGITAFQTVGMQSGASHQTPITIVHGATIASLAYLPLARAFATHGYRVLVYDGFGRGFSDRLGQCSLGSRPGPRPVSMDVLVGQLLELLDHLAIERTVLYGTSLGAAIIACFAARHPERVLACGFEAPLIRPPPSHKLTLLAVAARVLPPLARWLGRVAMVPAMRARGDSFGDDEEACVLSDRFRDQFEVLGHEADLLSLLTGNAVRGDRTQDHVAIGARALPVSFAYALSDAEMPRALVERTIALHPQPVVSAYEGGHFFSNGRQVELARAFDAFLRGALHARDFMKSRSVISHSAPRPADAPVPVAAVRRRLSRSPLRYK